MVSLLKLHDGTQKNFHQLFLKETIKQIVMIKKYLFAALILSSCVSTKEMADTVPSEGGITIEGRLFSALFHQQAAEYKALCFQAYNIARLRLDQSLAGDQPIRPRAIVTDIDETVLDNTPYSAGRALRGHDYEPQSWLGWTAKGEADTLAGAHSFFSYAASRGVEIFYVTNREEKERSGTLANLKRYGFPYSDDSHLIMKTTVSGKESRRAKIAETHDIIMLIGDNLSDFSPIFDKNSTEERTQNVKDAADRFGASYIVLPNANYGDWESALFRYNYNLTTAQKDSIIRSVLKVED